ncbi:YdeI/OmpD-associated family protein [Gulosibacter sp. 10]|uniref:YdeI/OmpD-associated family protein n=1 Tax=Gulosibacter sp. 10 TaxID=1255570 RepID=UPI00097F440E|nr:YdeI/OmpD-associated family protein [Gulosibacter sp. 10]SJM52970.1 hypothetical protein FM112_02745 [Gulosibacter sp. 10]
MNATAEPIRFRGRLERIGDRSLVRLPEDASAALPSRGQVAASAVVQDRPFATVVEPDGRRGHWLRIDEALGAELETGAAVAVELRPADAWPEPELAEDFRAALDAAPDVLPLWEDITPMARWEWMRWVGATKNPATRARRVEVGIDKLRSGKRRPCCFDLSSCTDPEVAKSGKLIEAE